MKKIYLKYLFLSCSVMILLSACRKDAFKGKETLDAGKTFVWVTEAPTNNQFFDVFTNVKVVQMFTLRRDAATKADLQKAVTISLTYLPKKIADAGYSEMPAGTLYTLPSASQLASGGAFLTANGITQASNGDLTIKFAAGEFEKNIIYNIDGSQVDLSKQYATAYAISNFAGFTKKVGADTILSTVAIKNKYDGVYSVTGSYSDANIPAATGVYPYVVELQTISATANDVYNRTLGDYGFLFNVGDGTTSAYGSFAPEFTFDLSTNALVLGVNAYGQGSGGHKRSLNLDPTGANSYDAGSKTFKVKYVMISDGVVRCKFDETYTYTGSR